MFCQCWYSQLQQLGKPMKLIGHGSAIITWPVASSAYRLLPGG